MMELFSSRLDQLHNHQASTLQELQMARMEMGRVQEMLQTSTETNEPEAKETESTDSDAPLDGAKARLEVLRESLYKREREISMLIDGGGFQNGVAPSAYTRLLAAVVRQAHLIYAEVTEAKQQFDQMAEDNRKAVAEARNILTSFQDNQPDMESIDLRPLRMDQSEISLGDQVPQAEVNLQKHEVLLVALECIKAGVTPTTTGSVSEDELTALDESVKSFEERFKNSDVLNLEVGKSVGQQLLFLQAELKQAKEENKKMTEHYTAERTLRKKYYNMVEDMKGIVFDTHIT
ncbi:uncharacterized protein LOC108255364 [Ictalurus punctatus]|uniref:Uncharacterized protein LOC108255364 n=1 Tax=Ictalurus punctatus TaxID=7998 RepID=A0A979EJY9_ICTPU|nr:uncharacterized protein LOC108255364 [Ictalurus punctatus]XP_053530594.1 uncharacterized protein LOC108255364 [Ictalurus punctatus]